jgi:hypothetical protein
MNTSGMPRRASSLIKPRSISEVMIATPSTLRSSMRRTHPIIREVWYEVLVRIRSYPCCVASASKLCTSSGKKGLVMSETINPISRLRPDTSARAWLLG